MLDHVGYLVRDLDGAVAELSRRFATDVTRTVDRPQWTLFGYYLGPIEVFTFTDPERLEERLCSHDIQLDHVAWSVDDIEAAMARFEHTRWSGPDLRGEAHEPFVLGDTRHIWTTGLQLIEYPRTV